MMNEEAIGFLRSRVDLIDKCYPDVKDYREALITAIKALEQKPCDNATLKDIFCMGCEYKEQEPCNDCISRQAVIGIVSEYAERFNGYIDSPNDSEVYAYARGLLLSIEKNINAVPPVTPQPKVCEWLKELQELRREYTCSECRYSSYGFSDHPCSVCRRGYYPRHSMTDYYEMEVSE